MLGGTNQEKVMTSMTRFILLRRAARLWNVPYVPKEINRANAIKWIKSVERLGDKWLVGKPRTKDQLMPKVNQ